MPTEFRRTVYPDGTIETETIELPHLCSPEEFLAFFLPAEINSLMLSTDPMVSYWKARLFSRTSEIDLGSTDVSAALTLFATLGLLPESRIPLILPGATPA